MKTIITYLEKYSMPIYGETLFIYSYKLVTFDFNSGIKNTYIVEAILRGLEQGKTYLETYSVEAKNNNEDTLTSEAIASYMDEYFFN